MSAKTVTMERLSGKIERAHARKARSRVITSLEERFDRAEAAATHKRPSAAGWHPEPRRARGPRSAGEVR